jgi:hypothetical protein
MGGAKSSKVFLDLANPSPGRVIVIQRRDPRAANRRDSFYCGDQIGSVPSTFARQNQTTEAWASGIGLRLRSNYVLSFDAEMSGGCQ